MTRKSQLDPSVTTSSMFCQAAQWSSESLLGRVPAEIISLCSSTSVDYFSIVISGVSSCKCVVGARGAQPSASKPKAKSITKFGSCQSMAKDIFRMNHIFLFARTGTMKGSMRDQRLCSSTFTASARASMATMTPSRCPLPSGLICGEGDEGRGGEARRAG